MPGKSINHAQHKGQKYYYIGIMKSNIVTETNNSHKNHSSKVKQKMTSSIYQNHAMYSLVSDEKERE